MYLLDTNHCIYLINGKYPEIARRLARQKTGSIALSSITTSELWYGVENSARREQNRAALAKFLLPLEVLPYDEDASQAYGKLRAFLGKNGRGVGSMDLLIAAHAVSLKGILVTHNLREFRNVPELKLEDWTEG
jgi:tRNA(fMet)-specific endonuclease VapC